MNGIPKYNLKNCFFAQYSNYLILSKHVGELYEICEFDSFEECEYHLKELQKINYEKMLGEDILNREWWEIFSFKGVFEDKWRIICKYSLNFFEKRK